jgi:hypothetical protein
MFNRIYYADDAMLRIASGGNTQGSADALARVMWLQYTHRWGNSTSAEAGAPTDERHTTARLRLADLIAALSQVTDLGMGQPPEDAVRSCLLATSLARRMDVSERDVGDIYYTTLLQHIGCTAYAHETAALFGGNDVAVRAGGAKIYFGDQREGLPYLLFELGKGATPLVRAQAVITAISKGQRIDEELFRANCEVAVRVSQRLGLGTGVQRGLNEIYERWDGKGNPRKLAGDDTASPARFAQVASQAILFGRLGGPELAAEVIGRRAGIALDPSIKLP